MQIDEILAQLDSEIARLQQAKNLLNGTTLILNQESLWKREKKKRVLSPEAIAKIAAAQKKRWAKVKKAAKQ